MDIKTDIYELLNDYIDDSDKVSEVYDKVSELETSIRESSNKDIKKLKDYITEIEAKNVYAEEQNKLLNNIIKHYSLFRGALNFVVHKYEEKHQNEIVNIDYDDLIKKMKYKSRILSDNDGFKYSIARINGECDGLSVKLCELYLSMNDSFHPKLKPIKNIENAIGYLKEVFDNNCMPDYHKEIGLTKELLIEFEDILKKNSKMFV